MSSEMKLLIMEQKRMAGLRTISQQFEAHENTLKSDIALIAIGDQIIAIDDNQDSFNETYERLTHI